MAQKKTKKKAAPRKTKRQVAAGFPNMPKKKSQKRKTPGNGRTA